MGDGEVWGGGDTRHHHLALVGGMAGWYCAGPLRGLLLNPVTLRDDHRRWKQNIGDGKVKRQPEVEDCLFVDWLVHGLQKPWKRRLAEGGTYTTRRL